MQVIAAAPENALTRAEADRLSHLELAVEKHWQGFRAAGLALMQINESRLYRQAFPTFEAYLIGRWGIHKSHAHRMIGAAKAATVIDASPMGDIKPTSERQVRPLVGMSEDEQRETWNDAVAASGGQPTSADVEAAAARRRSVDALTSSESVEWYSPEKYAEAARKLMKGIDLDPASSHIANETIRAARFHTKEDNGLDKAWNGRVFLNWPGVRGSGDEWVTKLLSEFEDKQNTTEAVVLVFNADTSTDWMQELLRYPTCFVDGREKFRRPDGTIGDKPVHSNAVVYLGHRPHQFADIFGEFGRVVAPFLVARS